MTNAFLLLFTLTNMGKPDPVLEAQIKDGSFIDMSTTLSIVAIESAFRPKVMSRAGAVGLMQITPIAIKDVQHTFVNISTKKERLTDNEIKWLAHCAPAMTYTIDHMLDPAGNVLVGTCFYSSLLDHYMGDEYKAIAHYNGGTPAVKALERHKPWTETAKYLGKFDLYTYYIKGMGY